MKDGRLHHKALDLTGRRFGMLVAMNVEYSTKKLHWRYLCDCGRQCIKLGCGVTKELKRGGTPNCGCATRRLIGAGNRTHGMTRHPAYTVWRNMINRCTKPSEPAYKNYGARGITVCARWLKGFEFFWADMRHGYQRGLELDRADNEKGYSPSNCRWVSRRVNSMNRRDTVRSVDVPALSAATGLGRTTIYNRIRAGWPVERLSEPAAFTNRFGTYSVRGRGKGS